MAHNPSHWPWSLGSLGDFFFFSEYKCIFRVTFWEGCSNNFLCRKWKSSCGEDFLGNRGFEPWGSWEPQCGLAPELTLCLLVPSCWPFMCLGICLTWTHSVCFQRLFVWLHTLPDRREGWGGTVDYSVKLVLFPWDILTAKDSSLQVCWQSKMSLSVILREALRSRASVPLICYMSSWKMNGECWIVCTNS